MTMAKSILPETDSLDEQELVILEYYTKNNAVCKQVQTDAVHISQTKEFEIHLGGVVLKPPSLHSLKKGRKGSSELLADPILRVLGAIGKWQFIISILLFMFNLPCVFQLIIPEFESTLMGDVWCARPPAWRNVSVEKWKKISGVYKGHRHEYDPCSMKNLDYSLSPSALKEGTPTKAPHSVVCTAWEYTPHKQSIVSEWHLACAKMSPTAMAESMFSIGAAFGSVINGYCADKYGRRNLLMLSQGTQVLTSSLTAILPWYWAYLTCRCIQGFITVGIMLSTAILCLEITGGKWKGLIGVSYMYSYPVGYVIVAVLANKMDKWRHLHYGVTFLAITLLSAWWVMPESPRWLWTQKNIKQLMTLLEEATNMNGRTFTHDIVYELKVKGPMRMSHEEMKVKAHDLTRTPIIRKMSFTTPFLFFFTYFAYYGIVLRINKLYPFNIFKTTLFTGIVEVTATSVSLGFAGRNWVNDLGLIFFSSNAAGCLCLLVTALPEGSGLIPYCLIFARFCMAMCNAGLMSIVAELYPTKMRMLGAGWANVFNFIALLATANVMILTRLKEALPFFLMGMAAILSGFVLLTLPRSDCPNLPDTVHEVERPLPFLH